MTRLHKSVMPRTMSSLSDAPANFPSLAGQFLVAMPHMPDPRFRQAVVLLLGHTREGALGLVLNDPLDKFSFHELLKELKIENQADVPDHRLLRGGPVTPNKGFVLHPRSYDSGHSEAVNASFAWSFSVEILREIAAGRGPDIYRLALGTAGWSEGQLEDELARNDWLVAPASEALVFASPAEELWGRVLDGLGVDPNALVMEAGDA